jgi:hypothetical protein
LHKQKGEQKLSIHKGLEFYIFFFTKKMGLRVLSFEKTFTKNGVEG